MRRLTRAVASCALVLCVGVGARRYSTIPAAVASVLRPQPPRPRSWRAPSSLAVGGGFAPSTGGRVQTGALSTGAEVPRPLSRLHDRLDVERELLELLAGAPGSAPRVAAAADVGAPSVFAGRSRLHGARAAASVVASGAAGTAGTSEVDLSADAPQTRDEEADPADVGTTDLWQFRLDRAVNDLDLSLRDRIRLLSEVVRDPFFTEDVGEAVTAIRDKGFKEGHPEAIERLFPSGTTARTDLEGLTALRKQVPELLDEISARPSGGAVNAPSGSILSVLSLPLSSSASVFTSLASLAVDSEKRDELREEALNSLRRTPKGLETPKYSVVSTLQGPPVLGKPQPIELRAYDKYTVARTTMRGTSFSSGDGFNTLASYLFGKNANNEAMAMTMPVDISATATAEKEMTFVLPESSADAPPAPLEDSGVSIETIPARLVAVKDFAGIVTDREVERQKQILLDVLSADGSCKPVDESKISVLQYNSPFTIPWRRRNEVAIVVECDGSADAFEAASVTEAPADDGVRGKPMAKRPEPEVAEEPNEANTETVTKPSDQDVAAAESEAAAKK